MFGHKNVTRIAAIHDALRQIQTSTSQIGAAGNINNSTHRPAVDAHAQTQPRMIFDRAA